MGKSSSTKVKLPDPSPAELRNQALFGSMLEANLRDQGWIIQETGGGGGGTPQARAGVKFTDRGAFVGDNFYEVGSDEYNRVVNSGGGGGIEGTGLTLVKDPAVAAREAARADRLEQAETKLFDAFNKVITGDYSVSDTQVAQINNLVDQAGFTDFSKFSQMKGELNQAVQSAVGEVNKDIFKARGSIKGAASQQQAKVSSAADEAVNELTVLFSSSEDAVKQAVNELVNVGNIKIAEQLTTFRRDLDTTAARLGRSSADTAFAAEAFRTEAQAYEQLYAEGASAAAQQISALRQAQGQQVGDIRQTELGVLGNLGTAAVGGISNLESAGLGIKGNLRGMGIAGLQDIQNAQLAQQNQANVARFGLLQQAAQPFQALSGGGGFVQLQNALQQQGLSNLAATSGLLSNRLGQQLQERVSQPTTTTHQPFDFGALLGGIAGIGAAGIRSFV